MEKLRPTAFMLLLLSMCLIVGTVSAVERQTYIVSTNSHLVGTTEDKAAAYQSMVATAQAATGSLTALGVAGTSSKTVVSHVYENVMTGFAVQMTSVEAAYMKSMPGVVGVFQETMMQIQTTHTPEELGLNKPNGLWSVSNFGDDVIVGMLDTGVWPESKSFSDTGLGPIPKRWRGQCVPGADFTAQNCNKKLIGARYFYQGYEAVAGPINGSQEYKSARDSEGHGTHTSSTAAGSSVTGASLFGLASGVARGMAPKARIAAYKICWASGCASSDIIAAFDMAVADGVDVISLSVGSNVPVDYFQDPIAIASFGAVAKGVFVSCAAGNSGPGPGTLSNTAPWITTVGASTVDRSFPVDVILGSGSKTVHGISLYGGPGLGSNPLPLTTGSNCAKGNVSSAKLCLPESLDPNLVKGKIVLCYRGISARVNKGQVVLAAGGVGMVLSNSADYGEGLIADPHVLPATFVGYLGGQTIEAYAATINPVATLTLPTKTVLGVKPAPAVTDFSSRGPTVQNPQLLKPDVIGPGLDILAAWPSETSPTGLSDDPRRVNFNIISGTSMSCPHISGLGALIKAQHRTWSPAAIRSALMTTATTMDNSNSIITDVVSRMSATPYDYGSGFVQADKAADPGFIYDLCTQDYLNFLCATGYSSQTLQVFDKVPNPCPLLPVLRMEDFNYPSFVAIFKVKSAADTFTTTFRRTVTNVGQARNKYTASFTSRLPAGYTVSVIPSTLVFTQAGEKLSYVLTVIIPATPLPPVKTVYTFLSWTDGKRMVNSPIVMEKQKA